MEWSSLVLGQVIVAEPALPDMPQKIVAPRVLVIDFWVKPKAHNVHYEAANIIVCCYAGKLICVNIFFRRLASLWRHLMKRKWCKPSEL